MSTVNLAIEKVDLLLYCLNVVQNIKKNRVSIFGYSADIINRQITFTGMSRCFVEGDEEVNVLHLDIHRFDVPKNKYATQIGRASCRERV